MNDPETPTTLRPQWAGAGVPTHAGKRGPQQTPSRDSMRGCVTAYPRDAFPSGPPVGGCFFCPRPACVLDDPETQARANAAAIAHLWHKDRPTAAQIARTLRIGLDPVTAAIGVLRTHPDAKEVAV